MINFDDWLRARLAADMQEAGDLLRLALAEAEEDQRGLFVIAEAVVAAHGSLDNLCLSDLETLALSKALSNKIKIDQLNR